MELAGTGVALSIFNTCTKLWNVPLLAVTTSSVASASARGAEGEGALASASARGTEIEGVVASSSARGTEGEGAVDAVSEAASSALMIALAVGTVQVMRVWRCGCGCETRRGYSILYA